MRVTKKNKRKYRQHSPEFRKKAVARMEDCASVVGLAAELGIHWSLLYKWKSKQALAEAQQQQDATVRRETELLGQIAELKSALADKDLQVRFFRGALQNIEARRHRKSGAGGRQSTTKSGR